jgi:hypothetical protein
VPVSVVSHIQNRAGDGHAGYNRYLVLLAEKQALQRPEGPETVPQPPLQAPTAPPGPSCEFLLCDDRSLAWLERPFEQASSRSPSLTLEIAVDLNTFFEVSQEFEACWRVC